MLFLSILALGLNVVLGYHGPACTSASPRSSASALHRRHPDRTSFFPFQQSFLVAMLAAVVGTRARRRAATAARSCGSAATTSRWSPSAFGLIVITVLRNLDNITGGKKTLSGLFPPLVPFVTDGTARPARGSGSTTRTSTSSASGCWRWLRLAWEPGTVPARAGRGWRCGRTSWRRRHGPEPGPAEAGRPRHRGRARGPGRVAVRDAQHQHHRAADSFDFNRSMIILAASSSAGSEPRAGVLWASSCSWGSTRSPRG